jgi:uncharacterized Ntn-hydrolase superfamily protein
MSAAEVVRQLTDADAGRDHRQLHVMDVADTFAAHTGSACVEWCGHFLGDTFSVAGNMLAGPQVVDATAEAYAGGHRIPLPRRLIAALKAGEAVGGDRRPARSKLMAVSTRLCTRSLTPSMRFVSRQAVRATTFG